MKMKNRLFKAILFSCSLGIFMCIGYYYAPIQQGSLLANNARATVDCLYSPLKYCGNKFKIIQEIDKTIMSIKIDTTRGCIEFLETYVSSFHPKSPEVMATTVMVNGFLAIQSGQLSYSRKEICEQEKKQIEINIPKEVSYIDKARATIHGYD